jgi:hypothetical protein
MKRRLVKTAVNAYCGVHWHGQHGCVTTGAQAGD